MSWLVPIVSSRLASVVAGRQELKQSSKMAVAELGLKQT